MDLNDEQVQVLKIINGIILALFIPNLAFVIFNSVQYLYRMDIRKPLIVTLYVFFSISICCCIAECVLRIEKPKEAYF